MMQTMKVSLTKKEIYTIHLYKHMLKVSDLDNVAEAMSKDERDFVWETCERLYEVVYGEIKKKFAINKENPEYLEVDYTLDHAIIDFPFAGKRKMFYKQID